ncbi:MAG: P1 family peptidase [Bacillota bacterium]|nr:P1 family peptidase [Bacillota bacterium]
MRLRESGILVDWLMHPGPLNSITDVPGVRVGHGDFDGKGDPAAQTGVTVIMPHGGSVWEEQCRAAGYALNGSGEVAGWLQMKEFGVIETPIFLCGTPSVGKVYDGALEWLLETNPELGRHGTYIIPLVAETSDMFLNNARLYRAGAPEVRAAIAAATPGLPAEGCAGAGRGMTCYGFKSGIGTASRLIPDSPYMVGALTLCNFGQRRELTIGGVRVGLRLVEEPVAARPGAAGPGSEHRDNPGDGSIIIVVATDAPILSYELRRVAKRATLAVIRTGSVGHHSSGDIAIAFSTANRVHRGGSSDRAVTEAAPRPLLGDLFTATIEATEEAIYNCLCQAETTTGQDGRTVPGLPVERVREILRSERPSLVQDQTAAIGGRFV